MATKEQVFEIVRRALARIRRELAPEFDAQIRMDRSLVADLGLDSISIIGAVVAIELVLRIDPLSLDPVDAVFLEGSMAEGFDGSVTFLPAVA